MNAARRDYGRRFAHACGTDTLGGACEPVYGIGCMSGASGSLSLWFSPSHKPPRWTSRCTRDTAPTAPPSPRPGCVVPRPNRRRVVDYLNRARRGLLSSLRIVAVRHDVFPRAANRVSACGATREIMPSSATPPPMLSDKRFPLYQTL